MTWAFEQRLAPSPKLVLLALADNANDEWYCWPNQETIAFKASMTTRNLRRVLAQLEEQGYIRIEERRRSDGYRASNGYLLISEDKLSGEIQSTSHRTSVSSQEPSVEPPKKESAGEADWERFWLTYPRKTGKDKARVAWKAAVKRSSVAEILAGLERLLPSYAAREERFVPYPASWLNAGSWNDPVDPPPVQSAERGGKQSRPPIPMEDEWKYR